MALLQRAFLSAELYPAVKHQDSHIADCFSRILFPLFSTFSFSPSPTSLQASVVEELRLRALTLISKIFLHLWYIPPTGHPSTVFMQNWTQLLAFLENYSQNDSDIFAEAIQECLKNMLLVMNASGVFKLPGAAAVWGTSFTQMYSFCPTLVQLLREITSQMPGQPLHFSLPADTSANPAPAPRSAVTPLPAGSPLISKFGRSTEVLDC
jgi:hypothetical protein